MCRRLLIILAAERRFDATQMLGGVTGYAALQKIIFALMDGSLSFTVIKDIMEPDRNPPAV